MHSFAIPVLGDGIVELCTLLLTHVIYDKLHRRADLMSYLRGGCSA